MLTKILLADSNEEFRISLTDQLKSRYWVRSCPDGTQALAMLDSFCPDLLVVDLMLQGMDGLGVIQAARKISSSMPIIVASTYFPPYAVSRLEALHVDYSMMKPCSADCLVARIEDLLSDVIIPIIPDDAPFSLITAALLEIGMVPGRSGFLYIRDGILMLSENPDLRVTKNIYPEIARVYNTSPTAVEKDIRDLIAATWQSTDPALLRRYFLPAPNGQIPRPSNKVFLSTMTERLFSLQRCAK